MKEEKKYRDYKKLSKETFKMVDDEKCRQIGKWGMQNHSIDTVYNQNVLRS